MVGAIALRDAALVARAIRRVGARKRSQAHRRHEIAFDGRDDRARHRVVDEREREAADGEDLIRAHARVHAARDMIGIDDVVEAAGRRVPEARAKSRLRAIGHCGVAATGQRAAR